MTVVPSPFGEFRIVDQLQSALVDRSGTARSFVQDQIGRLFRWVREASTWREWEPTYTNLTIGNGTVSATYVLIGTTCHFEFEFTLGSTSSVDGSGVKFTLPVEAASTYTSHTWSGFLEDATSTTYLAFGFGSSVNEVQVVAGLASLSYLAPAAISATVPFTWTTGDRIILAGTYQIAT